MKKDKKATKRPFALEFIEEIPEVELEKINGGRRHKHKPPVFTTMHVSLPQPAFPHGDNG